MQNIEKYSFQNAVTYEYFANDWVLFEDLVRKMPIENTRENLLKKLIEVEDENYIYLLKINAFKEANSTAPFEFAREEIKSILMSVHKEEFLNKFENDLFNQAVEKGRVTLP